MPVVWTDDKGKVRVTQFADEYLERNRQPGESTESVVLRLALIERKKIDSGLEDATPILMKTAEMPGDRVNRGTWAIKGGKIDPFGAKL